MTESSDGSGPMVDAESAGFAPPVEGSGKPAPMVTEVPAEEVVPQPVPSDAAAAGQRAEEPADVVALAEALAGLEGKVAHFHTRAEQYESIIRRMQSRLEELQNDQVRTLLKPVITRLASLYTESVTAAERAAARGDVKAQKDFGYFADEIEEGLGMLDIESLATKVHDEFDAARHAARGAVPTADAGLDRTVASVVRQGFTYVGAERVLLPTIVKVHRFDPKLVAAETFDTAVASEPSTAAAQNFAEGVL